MEASQNEDKMKLSASDNKKEEEKPIKQLQDEWCQPKTPKASTPTNFTVSPMGPSDYAVSTLPPKTLIPKFPELGKYA